MIYGRNNMPQLFEVKTLQIDNHISKVWLSQTPAMHQPKLQYLTLQKQKYKVRLQAT